MNQANNARTSRLVTQARGGDREAFDGLVELYAPQVYNLSLRITGSPEEADDCVQETFVRAFSAMRSFRGEAGFFTWLYRVALNVARDAARRRAHRPLLISELAGPDPNQPAPDVAELARRPGGGGGPPSDPGLLASPSAGPEEAVAADRRRQLLLAAISSLPPHHREVIVLYDLQGLSYQQVARVTNTRVGTVKSRLNRARLALRDCLAPHLDLLRS